MRISVHPVQSFKAIAFAALLFSSSAVLAASGNFTHSFSATNAKPDQKTEAAVIAADERWSQAEASGDVAYIDQLLLPDYRSVNPDGTVHNKSAILSSAKKSIGSNERAVAVEKWRAQHPSGTSVVLHGDTAILTFYLKTLGPVKGIMSCDIFVYSGGHWHALYSQHSDAGK